MTFSATCYAKISRTAVPSFTNFTGRLSSVFTSALGSIPNNV